MRSKFIMGMVALAVVTFSFLSCSDDETKPSIIGTWQGIENEDIYTVEDYPEPISEKEDYNAVVEFKSDHTLTITGGDLSGTITGTWKLLNDNTVIEVTQDDGQVYTSVIDELTKSTLVFYIETEDTYYDESTETEHDATIKHIYWFTRK